MPPKTKSLPEPALQQVIASKSVEHIVEARALIGVRLRRAIEIDCGQPRIERAAVDRKALGWSAAGLAVVLPGDGEAAIRQNDDGRVFLFEGRLLVDEYLLADLDARRVEHLHAHGREA